jgi:hypothetical protein
MPASIPPHPAPTKSGKSHRDLAEKRRYRMVPVVLHAANATTASTNRPPDGVTPRSRGNDLLLDAGQQQLPVGQGQTQIGDIAEIIAAVDLHEVDALLLTTDPGRHQPHNPSHTSTPVREQTQKYPSGTRTPNLDAVPVRRYAVRHGSARHSPWWNQALRARRRLARIS